MIISWVELVVSFFPDLPKAVGWVDLALFARRWSECCNKSTMSSSIYDWYGQFFVAVGLPGSPGTIWRSTSKTSCRTREARTCTTNSRQQMSPTCTSMGCMSVVSYLPMIPQCLFCQVPRQNDKSRGVLNLWFCLLLEPFACTQVMTPWPTSTVYRQKMAHTCGRGPRSAAILSSSLDIVGVVSTCRSWCYIIHESMMCWCQCLKLSSYSFP